MADLTITNDPATIGDFGSRQGSAVDTLVIHTTEGHSIAGAEQWWDRPDVVASAHYVLDGKRISQRVSEGDAAYHAGSASVNHRSIGIEVVGVSADPATWTPEVMVQLEALAAAIVLRHAIPVTRGCPGIIGHCDVPDPHHPGHLGGASHHGDPGPFFPWAAFLAAVARSIVP